MMFGMQAQAQRDCCFQLSNPAGDTLHGIANLPGGDLPLSHSMSPLVFGATDVYDMIFSDANCLGIDEGAKVSIELELWCDGENILDGQHDLSRYCNITLQTFYEELHWIGTPMLQENYSFVYEYPGAIPIFSGTYNISNIAYDYFYFRFLTNTRSRIVVTWNQIFRDVQLIVHIRERIHGTDNSLYWNSHVEESEYYQIGGHQSHPSRVLASDTLTTAPYIERNDTIKDCEPVTVGMPPYTMDTTGDYLIAYVDTSCGYRIDSIVNYNYTHYVHPTTPTLSDSNITYCQRFGTPDTLRLFAEPNPALADHVDSIVAYWSTDGSTFAESEYLIPETDVIFSGPDTTLYYYVKRHDNVTGCESEVDTFGVRITPIPADPAVINHIIEYCVGDSAVALSYAAPAGQLVLWGLTADDVMDTTYVPSTATPDTIIYYLRLQDTTTVNQCVSDGYDSVTVRIFANPVVTVTADNDTLCFAESATLKAEPTNLTTYQWKQDGTAITGATDTTYIYTNNVTTETTFTFRVDVTEAHDSVSCAAHDTINILAYPEIGAPTAVRGDTSICGPGDVTLEVAAGANGTTARWYKGDKTTVIVSDTLTYTIHFDATDSVFVSSLNEYGCETPDSNWLKITVTVDTIPTVVLSADNNAEVCAESDMIIRSTVTPAYTPIAYAWTGTGLHAPLNEDSVLFNHDVAGQYIDTLTVTDAHGCIGMDTILVTVDTLPVIVLNVNYTIQDDNFCVGHNGEIIFTTPQYVNYSIDSGMTWQAYPDSAFLALPIGEYHLVVEDANGCKNHATTDSIRDAKVTIVPTLAADTNTHCQAPYGGAITITSVAPATGEYHYRIVSPTNDTTAYQTDTVFTELIDGFYTVIIEDTITGCIVTDTITVPTNQIKPTASFVGPNLICYLDSTTTFGLSYSDTNVVFREWSYVGSADSLANMMKYSEHFVLGGFPAGKHIFIGLFEDTITHCTNTRRDTVRVNSVNINLVTTPDYTVCAYDTITVYSIYYPQEPTEDTIVTYLWYNGNHVQYKAPGVYDTAIVIPSVSSNYISLVAYDNHGCHNTFGKTMSVWPLPSLAINTDEQNYCQNSNIDLHVTASSTAPYTYEWMKEGSVVGTNYALNINAGLADFDVTLTVSDAHGCISRDTVPVNVIEIPGAPVFDPDTQYFCNNSVTIDFATPAQNNPAIGDFSWNGGNPEETKTTGDYSAFYTYTENGVSCYSDTAEIRVEVKGAPVFTVEARYNSETTVDTAHARCYDPTATDTVKLTVNPAASSVLTYTYELNGVTASETMAITRTDPGAYIDTIHISVLANYPDGTTCDYDTTLYYYLTINGLPAVPDNFPHSYEGGDSTIFYCQGGNPDYNFNIPTGYTVTYNSLATAPDTAADNVEFVITETLTGCSSTYYFDIVEVATPHITLTSDLADDCSDTLRGNVVATISPATAVGTYERVYTWIPANVDPASPHSKLADTDTVTYTFRAPNDTIVRAFVTVNAESGPETSYSASCPSDTAKFVVTFQPAPDMPKLKDTYSHFIDSATAAYCYDETLPIIKADSFVTSAGAHVSIVDYTEIDTAGIYKIVANNDDAPNCPSDTLIFTVIRNREINPTANFNDYNGKVYYCEGTKPVYDFGTPENTNDSLVYFQGTTPLTAAPDTAGNYILTIYDKASLVTPKCSKDFPFEIIEVANPTATVTPHTNWKDTTQVCEGNPINVVLDFTISATYTYTAIETYVWDGVSSTTASGTFEVAVPAADTSVSFSYTLLDTIGAGIHGIACPFTYDSTIFFKFYALPDQPVYTGDTLFCAGDTVIVTESEFTFASTFALTTDVTLPDTIYAATKTITASVYYPDFTTCKSKDTVINIVRHELPIVKVTPKDTTICIYDTVKFTATGATTYAWSTGETTDFIMATDTNKYVVTGTDDFGCVNTDTAELKYFDVYTIKLSNDSTVCLGEKANISGTVTGTTGDFTLTWYKDTATTPLFSGSFASGVTDSHVITPDTSEIVNGMPVPTLYKLEVEDSHGCVSSAERNVIRISATDRPQFEFREIGGTESIRYMNANSGDQSAFEMYIKKNCWEDGVKVFVDFQIYKDGVPMTKAELANVLDDYIGSYNTSYSFDLTQNAPAITYQTMESSNYNDAANFFPQSEFMDGTMYDYDWFWMHFISERKITVNLGAWKPGSAGIYTFHYAVIVAGPFSAQNGSIYSGLQRIGGHSSHSGLAVKDTIAYDFFTIAVDTTYVGSSSDFDFVAPAIVTTSSSEDIPVEKVDMNVYPNPASNNVNVVLTGVKGQTMITVHDMSGKAVSSMRVNIDDNDQIINLPVDNYSQGIYFIKVVNGNAVMTKKLIIAR